MSKMASESQPPSPCGISYSQFSVDTKNSAGVRNHALCQCFKRYCFKGYFWAVIGGLCFFIVMPAGILLIIHGHFKGVALTMCLGALVLFVSICILPGAYIGLHHWRLQRTRRKRMRRMALNAIREQAMFANEAALISPINSISVVDA